LNAEHEKELAQKKASQHSQKLKAIVEKAHEAQLLQKAAV